MANLLEYLNKKRLIINSLLHKRNIHTFLFLNWLNYNLKIYFFNLHFLKLIFYLMYNLYVYILDYTIKIKIKIFIPVVLFLKIFLINFPIIYILL